MEIKEQVNKLFQLTVYELSDQGNALRMLWAKQYPPIPAPRTSIRFITDRLGVAWNQSGLFPAQGVSFYERAVKKPVTQKNFRHRIFWREIPQSSFLEKLQLKCTTPRLASRALARLEAYTRWLVCREPGFEAARGHVLQSQARWVTRIDARIGGRDLANADWNAKFSETGPFSAWPQTLREYITKGNKIEAIKQVRHLTGMGFADSKNFVERAIVVLNYYGIAVWNSNQPFYEWTL